MSMQLSRRTVLRGIGTAMALPLFEAMLPSRLLGAISSKQTSPLRMAFVYVPNGKIMADWTPKQLGREFVLPSILEPLEAHREHMLVLSGLTQHHARANGDGPGDHARALATFLTGRQARKTHGRDIRVGVSVDQVAAQVAGQATRFPSLELGCDRGAQAGNCDSGYSCAYSTNASWYTDTMPQAKEINPRLVFRRLFAGGRSVEDRKKYDARRGSILDLVAEDARDLGRQLSARDQRKLDEYLTSVNELERRIDLAASQPEPADVPMGEPDGVPKDYQQHLRLMYDLLALAFQTDLTRIATFVAANEGSNRPYPFLDVAEGHHDISHHGGDQAKQAKISKINRFHVEQFAYFLERLRGVVEPDGSTLLDNSMIVYGSGISDGNSHSHGDLPILLAGRAGGAVETGRHLRYPRNTPLNNLYMTMLDRMDVKIDALGDSTGRLEL